MALIGLTWFRGLFELFDIRLFDVDVGFRDV